MGTEQRIHKQVCGIWFMDEKSLLGLEKVARDIFAYLQKEKDNKEDIYLGYKEKEPEIKAYFSDSSQVQKNSFQEIYDLLDIRQKLTQKIIISMNCCGIDVSLILSSGKFSTDYFEYEITGSDNYKDIKNIVSAKIENWIDENKPDLLFNIWYHIARYSLSCVWICCIISWISSSIFGNMKSHYFDNYKEEVKVIMEEGISDNNRDRAIELVLQKQYDYVPEEWIKEKSKTGDMIAVICFLFILFFILMRICPNSHFAIGKGKKKIKFWKQYRKIIFIVIPTIIVIPILINLIF